MASKPTSVNGSESEFEFIETPKAPTPTFEKFEECGVKTTSVSARHPPSRRANLNWVMCILYSIPLSAIPLPSLLHSNHHHSTSQYTTTYILSTNDELSLN